MTTVIDDVIDLVIHLLIDNGAGAGRETVLAGSGGPSRATDMARSA
jgi:hypothetical protein